MLKQNLQYLFVVLFSAFTSATLVAEVNADEINKDITNKESLDIEAIDKEIKAKAINDVELFDQAIQFSRQEKWAQAEPIYRKLIERNNEWPEPANNLAILLLKTNRMEEAKTMLEQAVVSSPNYRIAQNNRSQLYNFLATQAYDKALGAKVSIAVPELELIETIYQPVKVIEIEVEKIIIKKEIVEVAAAPDVVSEIIPETAPQIIPKTTPSLNPDGEAQSQIQLTQERIKQQLIAWSRAWSQGDFEYYIQIYSENFQPSDASQSYLDWKNIRRAKLKFTEGINVDIENIRVFAEPLGKYALVEFIQNYQSSTYRDRVLKQMYMRRQQGSWLILSERTIKTYNN